MHTDVVFNDTSRIFAAHQKELLSVLSNIAKSGWWLLGENTHRFADEFSKFCGVKHCLPVANGTDALELALRAVIGPCDKEEKPEVITVANAGGYTTSVCRIIDAIPVYADIEEKDQLVNLSSLVNCLGPEVKAIVVTHLYGGVVDVPKVRQKLKEKGYSNIPIIEDCAQAHGAKVKSQRVGSLGDVATFSFYPTKNLGALGDAGAIVTSDADIFKRTKRLHQYGWKKKYQVDIAFGRNSRIDELQAGVLTCLLPHLDKLNDKRREICRRYRTEASSSLNFLNYGTNDYVGHLAVAKTPQRSEFMTFMKKQGIIVDIHYPILDCDQPGWKNMPMRIDKENNLNVSRESIKQIVSLPCFPMLTETEINHICGALSVWGDY